jgi:hypothetical protein
MLTRIVSLGPVSSFGLSSSVLREPPFAAEPVEPPAPGHLIGKPLVCLQTMFRASDVRRKSPLINITPSDDAKHTGRGYVNMSRNDRARERALQRLALGESMIHERLIGVRDELQMLMRHLDRADTAATSKASSTDPIFKTRQCDRVEARTITMSLSPRSLTRATQRADDRTATSKFIIAANEQRRGFADPPLPTDPVARMIATFAREFGQAPKARSDASSLSPAAKMIINANNLIRNGKDIDEAV